MEYSSRSRLFSNVDHFYFVARARETAPAELKSIHPGCFLHILLSAIHFALHKQWIPSTWFIKNVWVVENAWVLKKNWVKPTCSFWFQKTFLLGTKKALLEIYFLCQGWCSFKCVKTAVSYLLCLLKKRNHGVLWKKKQSRWELSSFLSLHLPLLLFKHTWGHRGSY